MKMKDVELELMRVRFENQRKAQEEEASRSRQLTNQVSTFSQTETELRSQLNIYVEKFKQVGQDQSLSSWDRLVARSKVQLGEELIRQLLEAAKVIAVAQQTISAQLLEAAKVIAVAQQKISTWVYPLTGNSGYPFLLGSGSATGTGLRTGSGIGTGTGTGTDIGSEIRNKPFTPGRSDSRLGIHGDNVMDSDDVSKFETPSLEGNVAVADTARLLGELLIKRASATITQLHGPKIDVTKSVTAPLEGEKALADLTRGLGELFIKKVAGHTIDLDDREIETSEPKKNENESESLQATTHCSDLTFAASSSSAADTNAMRFDDSQASQDATNADGWMSAEETAAGSTEEFVGIMTAGVVDRDEPAITLESVDSQNTAERPPSTGPSAVRSLVAAVQDEDEEEEDSEAPSSPQPTESWPAWTLWLNWRSDKQRIGLATDLRLKQSIYDGPDPVVEYNYNDLLQNHLTLLLGEKFNTEDDGSIDDLTLERDQAYLDDASRVDGGTNNSKMLVDDSATIRLPRIYGDALYELSESFPLTYVPPPPPTPSNPRGNPFEGEPLQQLARHLPMDWDYPVNSIDFLDFSHYHAITPPAWLRSTSRSSSARQRRNKNKNKNRKKK